MDLLKQKRFNEQMTKRLKLAKGGQVKRKYYATAGAVLGDTGSGVATGAAIGSVVPGIGTAIGAVAGGVVGLVAGLMSGGPSMPNIVDPVTGQQITDANGTVVATQQQLQSFASGLQGVNGVQNQQKVLQQLQQVASGQGPNPAQAMLAQSTGQNVANQAALMAGQRGAAGNVGLIAREAGQTGAAIQQNATGQAATLQAEQSLGALNQMGGIAGQQVAETQGALSAANNAATTNQGQLLGAQGQYNANITGAQGNVNTNNTSTTNALIPVGQAVAGGLANGAASQSAFNGTPSSGSSPSISGGAYNTPSGGGNIFGVNTNPSYATGGRVLSGPHKSHVANFLALAVGGKVPAMVSPGEVYLSPEKVDRVIHEGADPLKIGEHIKGKAKVKGDSRKNDNVPKTLDEGGVVISRTHVKSPEMAELFVRRAVHMKKGGK